MTSSTIALQAPRALVRTDARPSIGRLTRTELRKMVDTRAGFWLLLGVLGLMITTSIVAAFVGDTADHTLHGIFVAAVWPAYVLLPVVGILLVSSAWSQRTTLITFTLVPHRSP